MVNKDLGLELSAMHAVATALGELEPLTRARVLRWLQERFQGDASPSFSATPAVVIPLRAVPRVSAPDEFLAVERLAEMFGPREPEAVTPAAQPITVMLHEFVAEFQDIAREWDGATHALSAAS